MADNQRRLGRLGGSLTGDGQYPLLNTANLASGGTDNQVLTRTSTGMAWEDVSGGGTPHPSHQKPSITLSTREIAEGSTAQTVTGTINIPSGYTVSTITTPSVSAGTITHSANSTSFSWALSSSNLASPATLRVSTNVTTTNSGVTYTDQASSSIEVYRIWYTATATTAPGNVASMTSQGRFTSPETVILTQNSGGNGRGYIALPTRASGYVFKSAAGFAFVSTTHGVISTSWTLYSLDLGDADQTLVVTIEEA